MKREKREKEYKQKEQVIVKILKGPCGGPNP
jgi:hypothetical protein